MGYGLGALGVSAGVTYVLDDIATPPGVGVLTADLSGLGRSVGLIAAAAVAVPGAILAYHRQRALDQANTLVEQQHQHKITADTRADTLATKQHDHKVLTDQREHTASNERNLRDRYTTTAAQLAHEAAAIRLAGVYALASLADDWHTFGNNDERQVCIDLLCAYLRTEPPKQRRRGTDTSIQIPFSKETRNPSPAKNNTSEQQSSTRSETEPHHEKAILQHGQHANSIWAVRF